MLNSVSIQGRLVEEPELKQTMNGVSTVSFSIAHDAKYGKDKTTYFFKVVAWRQTAEFINKYFRKGQEILITGTLQNGTWEDKKGNKKTVTEIVADSVNFCGNNNGVKITETRTFPEFKATEEVRPYIDEEKDDDLPWNDGDADEDDLPF